MRRRPALAGALLAFAAAAAAFDKPVIQTPTCTHNNFRILEAVLPSILARSLRASRNSEGAPAAEYLDAHLGTAFRIAVDPSQRDAFGGRPSLGSTTMMSFSAAEQEIDIHHALLHLDGSDEELIIRDPSRLERTASRFWPSIVHEVSHARTAEGGARFISDSVIEDEYIAFERQLFFVMEELETNRGYLGIVAQAPCARDDVALLASYHSFLPRYDELSKLKRPTPAEKRERSALSARADKLISEQNALNVRCPRLDEPDGDTAVLLALFARSTGELEAMIKKTYEAKGRLSIDDPALIARARAQTDEQLQKFGGFLARSPLAGASESDPGYATLAALLATTGRIVDGKRKALVFWDDPKAAPAAVAEYKALLAAVRAQADRKRERYALVLRPFLPDEAPPSPAKE
jgi:hypothetical protein